MSSLTSESALPTLLPLSLLVLPSLLPGVLLTPSLQLHTTLPLSLSLLERFPALRDDPHWLRAQSSFEGSEIPSTGAALDALAVLAPVIATGPGNGEHPRLLWPETGEILLLLQRFRGDWVFVDPKRGLILQAAGRDWPGAPAVELRGARLRPW